MARTLFDLYAKGIEHTIDDGHGPVVVWLEKVNPMQYRLIRRAAQAAKATCLALRKDTESEGYKAVMAPIFASTREELIEFLTMAAVEHRRDPIRDEVANDEEWAKDDYLIGLRDAWEDKWRLVYLSSEPADRPEESVKVFEEMARFSKEVDQAVDVYKMQIVKDYENLSVDVLERKVAEARLEEESTAAFVNEFYAQQIFYAVRKMDNHNERIFSSRQEVDVLHQETLSALLKAYGELEVDALEGKDLAVITDSSLSSPPPEPEETEDSSGLKDAKV